MTPDQNPPVDPAALAAAETKALPRFPGYREMGLGEVIKRGDCFEVNGKLCASSLPGLPVQGDLRYFHPIEPVPHTEGRRSTGLKDMDGKEIFEGDTIEGRLRSWNLPTMGQIVYSTKHGCWANKNEGGATLLVEIDNIRIHAPQAPEGTSLAPARFSSPTAEEFALFKMAVDAYPTLQDAFTKAKRAGDALRAIVVRAAYGPGKVTAGEVDVAVYAWNEATK